jgi:predicted Ser/Thr protein kinase
VIKIKTYGNFNLEELELLGEGTQGKVYRIDSLKCVKIFKSKKVCSDELKTLVLAQGDSHFPRLYEAGNKFIIRECINGIELDKYLSAYSLTPTLSYKIVKLYEAMLRVGYTRLDSAIFHIFITPSGNLKLIDTAKALKKKTECPHLILSGLEELGFKENFLAYVKYAKPELYSKWIR